MQTLETVNSRKLSRTVVDVGTSRTEFTGTRLAVRDDAHDDVEDALARALELIRTAMSNRRVTLPQIDQLAGDPAVFQMVAEGLGEEEARHQVLCVIGGTAVPSHRLDHTLSVLHRARGRGLQVKALLPGDIATDPLVEPHGGTGGGAGSGTAGLPGVRVADGLVQDLFVVDQRVAVLRTPDGVGPAQTLLIRMPALVLHLESVFMTTWSTACPLPDALRLNVRRSCRTTKQILASLCSGEKDEVAARKLGLSVRTYRRHVADLMRDLRATSRFQAGVRAAEFGLL